MTERARVRAKGSLNGVHFLATPLLCIREIPKEPEPYCEVMETRSYTMLHIAAIGNLHKSLFDELEQ